MLNGLKIKTKLIIGVGAILFVTVIVGGTGYFALNNVIEVSDDQSKTAALEIGFEKMLAHHEKYFQTDEDRDYNKIREKFKDVREWIKAMDWDKIDPDALAFLEKGEKEYNGLLSDLKKRKDTNKTLLENLNTTADQMAEIFEKKIASEIESIKKIILTANRKFLMDYSYKNINHVVEVAFNAIEFNHANGKSREEALETLRNLHFDKTNYFFVVQSDYILVAHGSRAELEGMDFSKIKDKKTGKTFMVKLVDNAVKNGASSTEYYWTKPGKGDAVFPKVTMARHFKPWDLIVCAGVYIDDIESAEFQMQEITSKGLADILNMSHLEKTMVCARLASLYHMQFNAGKEKPLDLLTRITASPKADQALKNSTKAYMKSWNSYAENLEKAEKTAQLAEINVDKAVKILDRVNKKMQRTMAGTQKSAIYMIIVFIVIGLVLGIVTAFFLIRSILNPIHRTNDMIKDIAQGEGDLTKRLAVDSKDEIGELSGWIDLFIEKLQVMIKGISSDVTPLTDASEQMAEVADDIAGNSDQTDEKSTIVAASAEEMSAGMDEVAAASQETSANIQTVVAAIEEMRSTIQEISGNIAKGNSTTQSAVAQAQEVSDKMDELGQAASEINKVTETIAEISEQTNLLALNATIEAARAGEAGKGFAVVAGEIKALAQQTAAATKEISSRISNVQASTNDSVAAIGIVVKVINEINDIVAAVAVSIEEQSAATLEISNSVGQAALGVEEVSENVVRISSVAQGVSSEISEVSRAANQINSGSLRVKENASTLAKLAATLNEMVGRFKV